MVFSDLRKRHREFVNKVHNFRYPLSTPWRILATACYMSIPLIIAYPLWLWVENNGKNAKIKLLEAKAKSNSSSSTSS